MLRRSLGGLLVALLVIALSLMSPAPAQASPPRDSVTAIAQAAPDSAVALEQLQVATATHQVLQEAPNIVTAPRAARAHQAPASIDSLALTSAPVLGAGGLRRSPTTRTAILYPTRLPPTLAVDSLDARRWHGGSFTALALLTVHSRR